MEAGNVVSPGRSTLDSKGGLAYAAEQEATEQVGVDDGAVSSAKDSTETELCKIRLMRAIVESRDPSSKQEELAYAMVLQPDPPFSLGWIHFRPFPLPHRVLDAARLFWAIEEDDLMIRRFLRARDLDVEKASAMYLKYLKWRHSFIPNGSISLSEVPNELAQNKMFAQGHDKRGRPVTVIFGAKHFQNRHDVDEFKRFVVYALDKLCARMPPGQEKFVIIGDIKGWGYSNSDIRGYFSALNILQDYYPERLGKMFIVHAPNIFMTVWNVVCPFIDNRTKKKIVFVKNNKLKSTLLADIDQSQLPEIYGGQLPLIPIQDI